jgi:hypothetical protein
MGCIIGHSSQVVIIQEGERAPLHCKNNSGAISKEIVSEGCLKKLKSRHPNNVEAF